jgi:hypothetical protein
MMFESIRRLWRRPVLKAEATRAEPIPHEPPPAPAPPPGTMRVKVVSRGRSRYDVQVTDSETGRAIPVFAADWHFDMRERKPPSLTLKVYHRDLEYEGPATIRMFCPRCKAEVKAEREAREALPPPVSPPTFYGKLTGMTRVYDLGRLAAARGETIGQCPYGHPSPMEGAWKLGWLNHAAPTVDLRDVPYFHIKGDSRADQPITVEKIDADGTVRLSVPDHWREQES